MIRFRAEPLKGATRLLFIHGTLSHRGNTFNEALKQVFTIFQHIVCPVLSRQDKIDTQSITVHPILYVQPIICAVLKVGVIIYQYAQK